MNIVSNATTEKLSKEKSLDEQNYALAANTNCLF